MAIAEQVAQLVANMPAGGSKDPPVAGAVEKLVEALGALGAEGARALVDLVVDSSAGGDNQARYLLHAVVQHGPRAPRRAPVLEAVAAAVRDDERSVEVRAFLIRQLQTGGDASAVTALAAAAEVPSLAHEAAQALVAIARTTGANDAALRGKVVEALQAALGKAPEGARLPLTQALASIDHASALATLRQRTEDSLPDVRVAAVGGVARLSPGAGTSDGKLLLAAADRESGLHRVQATDACLRFAERMLAAGQREAAQAVYRHLATTRNDPSEAYLKTLAEQALKG